jgi:hypothetical protein
VKRTIGIIVALVVGSLCLSAQSDEWPRAWPKMQPWPKMQTVTATKPKAALKKTPVVKPLPVEESGCRDGVCPAPAAPAPTRRWRLFR